MDRVKKARAAFALISALPPAMSAILAAAKLTVWKSLSWWAALSPLWIPALLVTLLSALACSASVHAARSGRRRVCGRCAHRSPEIPGREGVECLHYSRAGRKVRPRRDTCPDFYGSVTRGYTGK